MNTYYLEPDEPTPPPDYTEEDSIGWSYQFEKLFDEWMMDQTWADEERWPDGFPEVLLTVARETFEANHADVIQEKYLQWFEQHYADDSE